MTDKAKHDAREQETEVKPSESHLRLSMSSGNVKLPPPLVVVVSCARVVVVVVVIIVVV